MYAVPCYELPEGELHNRCNLDPLLPFPRDRKNSQKVAVGGLVEGLSCCLQKISNVRAHRTSRCCGKRCGVFKKCAATHSPHKTVGVVVHVGPRNFESQHVSRKREQTTLQKDGVVVTSSQF